jgi:hypothetical protein
MYRHLLIAFLALVAACRDGETTTPPPADGGQPDAGQTNRYACTVDSTQLARATECLWDDACPCGSYCKAGSCGFDCRSDADCGAGKTCDGFGRCVKADADVAPQVDDSPRGTLKLSAALVQLDPLHLTGEVMLSAVGAPVPQAKVVVKAGFEVKCGADAAFSTSCVLPELKPEKPVTLDRKSVV